LHSTSSHDSLGLIKWREELIELVDLNSVVGLRTRSIAPAQALVVKTNASTLVFAIERVLAMSGPNDVTEVSRISNYNTGGKSSILAIGEGRRITYELIDLARMADERLALLAGVAA
jgi:chemotaxis signal transduction protein